MNVIQIINLPHRKERKEAVLKEMALENAPYMFWDGIMMPMPKQGVSKAHKQIVRHAKEKNLPYVIIAEDDMKWTGTGAWKYFLDNIPKEDWDLYLSSYYSGQADSNNMIKNFCGLTLYAVHSRYFDTFLSVPENRHLDTALSMAGGKFYVSPLFCTTQAPGYSDQRGRFVDDSRRIKGKQLFGR